MTAEEIRYNANRACNEMVARTGYFVIGDDQAREPGDVIILCWPDPEDHVRVIGETTQEEFDEQRAIVGLGPLGPHIPLTRFYRVITD